MGLDVSELEPVSRRSTAEIVADRIRAAIMRGTFAPGTQLGEVDLANRLGVSRGPLREAMQRLVAEGLLRSERHRGLFVRELGPDDVRDVYLARTAVERAAALKVLEGDRAAVSIVGSAVAITQAYASGLSALMCLPSELRICSGWCSLRRRLPSSRAS